MLKSLFGDLGAPEDPYGKKSPAAQEGEPDRRFAARAVMESVATEVNERGQMVDRHLRDLVVTGSPAQAMRDHFAATRTDAELSGRLITLFDPSRIWASSVVKALSDAGGMPIERLHLRDHATLGTLAVIERTVVVRRFDDSLKVYHADVRAPGRDNAEIPLALMERSHLTAVIVGSMKPHAIDDMLLSLYEAASQPMWRCPALLFMLPPNAVWIANKITSIAWPEPLQVQVQNESLTSASAVWNSVLGVWDRVKGLARWGAPMPEPEPQDLDFPIKVADFAQEDPEPGRHGRDTIRDSRWPDSTLPSGAVLQPDPNETVLRNSGSLDPLRAHHSLVRLLAAEGVLACALVDSVSGLAVASEARPELAFDMVAAVAGSAQVLRAHRLACRGMGMTEPVDEVIVSAGSRQQLIHRVARHQDLYLVTLLDKNQINLALARLKVVEAEKGLL